MFPDLVTDSARTNPPLSCSSLATLGLILDTLRAHRPRCTWPTCRPSRRASEPPSSVFPPSCSFPRARTLSPISPEPPRPSASRPHRSLAERSMDATRRKERFSGVCYGCARTSPKAIDAASRADEPNALGAHFDSSALALIELHSGPCLLAVLSTPRRRAVCGRTESPRSSSYPILRSLCHTLGHTHFRSNKTASPCRGQLD